VPEPPRLPLADLVAAHAHGSIDISDGLVADAGHVAEASGAGLIIEAAKVPLSAIAQSYLVNTKTELRDLLTGGDDYQTLFTAPESVRAAIEASGLVARIGRVEQGAGVKVLDASGKPMSFEGFGGWRHFSPKP
jgi:thiamine-monophosphate kinase